MSTAKRTTMSKLNRERELKEKRELKQERKDQKSWPRGCCCRRDRGRVPAAADPPAADPPAADPVAEPP